MTAHFVHSAVRAPAGVCFNSSSATLNAIQRAALYASLSNLIDVPSDCPQRERRGWLGDAQSSFEAAAVDSGLPALYSKWLRDITDTQRVVNASHGLNGSIADTSPWYGHGIVPAEPGCMRGPAPAPDGLHGPAPAPARRALRGRRRRLARGARHVRPRPRGRRLPRHALELARLPVTQPIAGGRRPVRRAVRRRFVLLFLDVLHARGRCRRPGALLPEGLCPAETAAPMHWTGSPRATCAAPLPPPFPGPAYVVSTVHNSPDCTHLPNWHDVAGALFHRGLWHVFQGSAACNGVAAGWHHAVSSNLVDWTSLGIESGLSAIQEP